MTVCFRHSPPCINCRFATLTLSVQRALQYTQMLCVDFNNRLQMDMENIFKSIWKNPFCYIIANYCLWQTSLSTGLLMCNLVFHILRGNSDLRKFLMKVNLTQQDHANDKLVIFCRNLKIFSNVYYWHIISFLFSNVALCGPQSLQRQQKTHCYQFSLSYGPQLPCRLNTHLPFTEHSLLLVMVLRICVMHPETLGRIHGFPLPGAVICSVKFYSR